MAESEPQIDGDGASVETQAQQQTGRPQVRVRFDQRDMHTSYANAFRTNATAEEVIVDFGLNQVVSPPSQQNEAPASDESGGEILFQVTNRVILNYYSAKRLVLTLGQIIRRYEGQFGELNLNVSERTKPNSGIVTTVSESP